MILLITNLSTLTNFSPPHIRPSNTLTVHFTPPTASMQQHILALLFLCRWLWVPALRPRTNHWICCQCSMQQTNCLCLLSACPILLNALFWFWLPFCTPWYISLSWGLHHLILFLVNAVPTFSDRVTAAFAKDDKTFITLPNTDYIPEVEHGPLTVHLWDDGHFGLADPVHAPQIFSWKYPYIGKNPLCQLALACITIASTAQTIANLCSKTALVENSSILPLIFMQHEAVAVKIANTSILLASHSQGGRNTSLL